MTEMGNEKNGFFSGVEKTTAAIRPPGFSARRISDRALDTFGRKKRPKRQMTASNEASSTVKSSASITRASAFFRPAARNTRVAMATKFGAMSVAST
jgi:hypothetical protein